MSTLPAMDADQTNARQLLTTLAGSVSQVQQA
jgi:hypothetical protein